MEVTEARTGATRGSSQERRQFWLPALLAALLVLATLVAAGVGAVPVPLRLLVRSAFGLSQLSADQSIILFSIRLPRIIAAASWWAVGSPSPVCCFRGFSAILLPTLM